MRINLRWGQIQRRVKDRVRQEIVATRHDGVIRQVGLEVNRIGHVNPFAIQATWALAITPALTLTLALALILALAVLTRLAGLAVLAGKV